MTSRRERLNLVNHSPGRPMVIDGKGRREGEIESLGQAKIHSKKTRRTAVGQ